MNTSWHDAHRAAATATIMEQMMLQAGSPQASWWAEMLVESLPTVLPEGRGGYLVGSLRRNSFYDEPSDVLGRSCSEEMSLTC